VLENHIIGLENDGSALEK